MDFNVAARALMEQPKSEAAYSYPKSIKSPLDIRAIVFDLDGTLTASYKMLEAVKHLYEHFKELGGNEEFADRFLQEYLMTDSQSQRRRNFQNVLHSERNTHKAYNDFIRAHPDLLRDTFVLDAAKAMQAESFKLYEGVKEFLETAHAAGVPVFIYTNSMEFFAVRRMYKACINPDHIAAIWARPHDQHLPLAWMERNDVGDDLKKFADKLIVYTYKKPDATPFIEIAKIAGITAQNILMVGEGVSDLRSVFHDGERENVNNPSATLATQDQGAADICVDTQAVNQKLRPGAEELGIDALNKRIERMGVVDRIIRLIDGIPSLVKIVKDCLISLSPPPVIPIVVNGALAAPEIPSVASRKAVIAAATARPGTEYSA